MLKRTAAEESEMQRTTNGFRRSYTLEERERWALQSGEAKSHKRKAIESKNREQTMQSQANAWCLAYTKLKNRSYWSGLYLCVVQRPSSL